MSTQAATEEAPPIPQPTLDRVSRIVAEFRERKLSGSVTIVLHFLNGNHMPSDVGLHERQVGTLRADRQRS